MNARNSLTIKDERAKVRELMASLNNQVKELNETIEEEKRRIQKSSKGLKLHLIKILQELDAKRVEMEIEKRAHREQMDKEQVNLGAICDEF